MEQAASSSKTTPAGSNDPASRDTAGNIPETLELIKVSYNQFVTTGGTDNIDNAIGLTEGLASRNISGLEPLLLHLRQVRSGSIKPASALQFGTSTAKGKSKATSAQDDMAGGSDHLSGLFGRRFERFREVGDIEKAIRQAEEAVAATPVDHPDRVSRLSMLGYYFNCRYQRLGALEDLEMAIARTEEAVAATSVDDPDRSVMLVNLSSYLGQRYQRLGTLGDLEEAIKRTTEVVEAAPAGHPHLAVWLNNLSNRLIDRYKRLGALEDLEKAIERSEQAVRSTPAGHPSRAPMLSNLGNHLSNRYRRLGALEDLEKAIEQSERAIEVTPANHPDRPAWLSNLGNRLSDRYKRLGAMEDLEKAIERTAEAVKGTPADHPDWAQRLSNLGNRLGDRYQRLEAPEDLEKAIEHTTEAVERTPADHPDLAQRLSNLGNRLGSRYQQLGVLEDLEKAIELSERAVEATPVNHTDRANMVGNLSTLFSYKFQRLRALEDIGKAIRCCEEAVESLPSDHYLQGTLLTNLGAMLSSTKSATPENIHYALGVNLEAWNLDFLPPRLRITAARNAATLYSTLKKWQESCSLLTDAVKLLPKVSPRLLRRDDQQYQLSEFTRLASNAVSATLQAGSEASDCLSLLELGRGIIMGLVIDCRSSLLELRKQYPDVHDRFDRLRIRIDSLVDNTVPEQRHKRQKDIDELEELSAFIRNLPGFAGFQLPPPAEDLMAIAEEGPIVILNCTEIRSDAIIVTNSAIKVLPLPGLESNDVNKRMEELNRKLIRGKSRTYPARNAGVESLLLWLWDAVVGPVLEELQLQPAVDDSNLPRVWWIGVGSLSMAPFHAAGDHSPGSTRNTLCRAVSSYIPTIKALSYAREKKLGLLSRNSRLLLVTMPKTPKNSPLSSAYEEVGIIISVVEEGTTIELLDSPSAAEVVEKLKTCDAVHFTCHGVSNGKNPSNSHLLLCKDNNTEPSLETVDKLTVGTISSANIKDAQIAYLSACSTARNDSVKLADESIHIASAFQLAGFSHVLATLWESNDKACLQVSSEFYRLLFANEPLSSDGGHGKVSMAFHKAVKKLRDENWKQPLLWASFIHTGA